LEAALSSLGVNKRETKALLNDLDLDGDGELDFAEFVAAYVGIGARGEGFLGKEIWEQVSRSLDDQHYLRVLNAIRKSKLDRSEEDRFLIIKLIHTEFLTLSGEAMPLPIVEKLSNMITVRHVSTGEMIRAKGQVQVITFILGGLAEVTNVDVPRRIGAGTLVGAEALNVLLEPPRSEETLHSSGDHGVLISEITQGMLQEAVADTLEAVTKVLEKEAHERSESDSSLLSGVIKAWCPDGTTFTGLGDDAMQIITENMRLLKLEAGAVIAEQGLESNTMYILLHGGVSLHVRMKKDRTLTLYVRMKKDRTP